MFFSLYYYLHYILAYLSLLTSYKKSFIITKWEAKFTRKIWTLMWSRHIKRGRTVWRFRILNYLHRHQNFNYPHKIHSTWVCLRTIHIFYNNANLKTKFIFHLWKILYRTLFYFALHFAIKIFFMSEIFPYAALLKLLII